MRKFTRVLLYCLITVLTLAALVSVFFVFSGGNAAGKGYFGPLDVIVTVIPLIGICVMTLFISYRTAGKESK